MGFLWRRRLGPVGILCVRRTLEHGARYGLVIGVSAASCDMVSSIVAAFGITLVSDFITPRTVLDPPRWWDHPARNRICRLPSPFARGQGDEGAWQPYVDLLLHRPACVYQSPDALRFRGCVCSHRSQAHRRPSGLWSDARCRRLFRFPNLVCPARGACPLFQRESHASRAHAGESGRRVAVDALRPFCSLEWHQGAVSPRVHNIQRGDLIARHHSIPPHQAMNLAMRYATPAARLPTRAVCSAPFSFGTPVKWPITKPNTANASKVMAADTVNACP